MVSKNFVEQVKSLRINYDTVIDLPSANSKLPYFMEKKAANAPPQKLNLPTKPAARHTIANYADIVKGIAKLEHNNKPPVPKKQSSNENEFFITAKEASNTNLISAKSKESNQGVGITEKEFLHLIQDLEDQNLFILGNIE
jgi:hypothetical protein